MGFLSNLFGGNKEDKALREALAQIQRGQGAARGIGADSPHPR